MAIRNPTGKATYWYEGTPSTYIKPNVFVSFGKQSYWYLGRTTGYITPTKLLSKPKAFGILIGF